MLSFLITKKVILPFNESKHRKVQSCTQGWAWKEYHWHGLGRQVTAIEDMHILLDRVIMMEWWLFKISHYCTYLDTTGTHLEGCGIFFFFLNYCTVSTVRYSWREKKSVLNSWRIMKRTAEEVSLRYAWEVFFLQKFIITEASNWAPPPPKKEKEKKKNPSRCLTDIRL